MKNFITIEGCDGVGKTCQTSLLKKYCAEKGLNVVFSREPGGSAIAEKIRNIILDADNALMDDMCEAFLYAASRVQHLNEIIIPALTRGSIVICDRYVDSSYAYQGVARGLGLDRIMGLNRLAVGEYMPEYTVFLELTPEQAFLRKGGADKKDRLEAQERSFYDKVYQGYHDVIDADPDRFIVIDASGTKEQTHSAVVRALIERGILE